MAKSNKSDLYSVSLFPMFNILISTLGVLIFILGSITALSIGVGKTVSISAVDQVADTYTHNRIPHYISWDGVNLIAYPEQHKVSFDRALNEIKTYEASYEYISEKLAGTEVERLFHKIKSKSETDYLVVLIRPTGFNTLKEIRGYIEQLGIDLGYEPVQQGWVLKIK